jgi:hypothetical protein
MYVVELGDQLPRTPLSARHAAIEVQRYVKIWTAADYPYRVHNTVLSTEYSVRNTDTVLLSFQLVELKSRS